MCADIIPLRRAGRARPAQATALASVSATLSATASGTALATALAAVLARVSATVLAVVLATLLATVLATVLACLSAISPANAADLVQTIAAVKPSVVGIATYQKTRSPAVTFFGTGFAVGDGLTILTNAHVVAKPVDSEKFEILGVLVGTDGHAEFRAAQIVGTDREHDLARLRITGQPLPVLKLGDSSTVKEGQALAFTGFPLGMALGFTKVTHRAMVSALTPIVRPALNSSRLDPKSIQQLQKSAFGVFQLDGTAYPGNSGSPLYDPESGQVYGIINMVYVKGLKETAISQPSGITYAIQSNYMTELLARPASTLPPPLPLPELPGGPAPLQ